MDIQEKLDSIERRKQELINRTPEEQKNKIIKTTYDEYVSAKEISEYAPEQLQQAETNYYKAKYGLQYIDKQKEKYKAESIQVSDKKLQAHKKQMGEVNNTLDHYKNAEEYNNHINEIKAIHLAKIKTLIQKIRLSEAPTNQQKTIFTEQEEDVIRSYIITLNWFIGLFTLYYIFINRSNINTVTISQTIFLLSIIFLVRPLIHVLKTFSIPFQVGYDPMKSKKPWFLWVIFILGLILLWVYLDFFSMLLQRTFTAPADDASTTTATAASTSASNSFMVGLATTGTYLHGAVNSIIDFITQVYQNTMNMYAQFKYRGTTTVPTPLNTENARAKPRIPINPNGGISL
jgi:hypothetical protein